MTESSRVFNSQICPQFRFPYANTDSHGDCCSWVAAPINCDSLYSHVSLSNSGGRNLLYDFTSLTVPRKVVDFSVCSTFYLLSGQSGNLQASYMPGWKTEICSKHFISVYLTSRHYFEIKNEFYLYFINEGTET